MSFAYPLLGCMYHLGNCTQNLGACVYMAFSGKKKTTNQTPNQITPPPTNSSVSIGLNLLADLFSDVAYNQSPFNDG